MDQKKVWKLLLQASFLHLAAENKKQFFTSGCASSSGNQHGAAQNSDKSTCYQGALQSEDPTQPCKASVKWTKPRFGNCYKHHSCLVAENKQLHIRICKQLRGSNPQLRTLASPPTTKELRTKVKAKHNHEKEVPDEPKVRFNSKLQSCPYLQECKTLTWKIVQTVDCCC